MSQCDLILTLNILLILYTSYGMSVCHPGLGGVETITFGYSNDEDQFDNGGRKSTA